MSSWPGWNVGAAHAAGMIRTFVPQRDMVLKEGEAPAWPCFAVPTDLRRHAIWIAAVVHVFLRTSAIRERRLTLGAQPLVEGADYTARPTASERSRWQATTAPNNPACGSPSP